MTSIFDLFAKIQSKTPEPTGPVSWVIAGLGNPGIKYERTRHNVGFMAIDLICSNYKINANRLRFHGLTAEAMICNQHVLLLKPQTYMNASGESIREALDWYKLPSERLIVIQDDISLPPGRQRIRSKGSAGGHNGIKSIIAQTGTDIFPRIKIGVGSPQPDQHDMIDWVLGTFSEADGRAVTFSIQQAAAAVEDILQNGCPHAENMFNGKAYAPPQQAAPESERTT